MTARLQANRQLRESEERLQQAAQAAVLHIFDRFERAVADMTYSGIGLGLSITRQIAEGHGGSIRVASAPGQGSTFTVEQPLSAA